MRADAERPNWPDVLSHPADGDRDAVALERHLLDVATRARDVTPPDAETADGRSLRDAAELVGLLHDVGKATEWFQTHIDNGTDDGGPTHHARLGGLLAWYALRRRGYGPRTQYAGLVAVAKHHGTLPDYEPFVEDNVEQSSTWDTGYNGDAARQANHIEATRPEFARGVIDDHLGDGAWAEFVEFLPAGESASNARAIPPDGTVHEQLKRTFFRSERGLMLNRGIGDRGAYLDALRLFGALTFADKTHAAGVEADDDRLRAKPLTAARVRHHIDGLGSDAATDSLEARLNAVRADVQDRIDGGGPGTDPIEAFLDADVDVATLTLPTGYGKTLAGLLAAARIREATGGERIVYALPFTSVIDQTEEVLENVFTSETADGADGDPHEDPTVGRRLTSHHHLSESLTLPDGEGEAADGETTDEEFDRAVMLAESWRSGVTLSTFVQLFETLAGPDNGQSMKLPSLYGSVVVVDEPQALPLTWWPLVERLVDALVTEFDATVVMMTATQPRILDEERTYPLVGRDALRRIERDRFDDRPDRVEYEFHPTALRIGTGDDAALGYEEAADRLATEVGDCGSTLAVCNTIDSAAELFERTTDRLGVAAEVHPVDVAREYERVVLDDGVGLPDDSSERDRRRSAFARHVATRAGSGAPAMLYLSTRLRPCDRQFLLGVASALTSCRVPLLVVSTQLVEAGVDVSFDRVYRDFAPLDSIVQAAGRCNRSFERYPDTGTVTVWRLGPPRNKSEVPGEVVYARRERDTDLDLLTKTREALAELPVEKPIPASELDRASVERYHDAVGDAVATVASDNSLRNHFERANGARLRAASLVQSRFTFEVYVCRTQRDETRVADFRRAERDYDFGDASDLKDRLAEIRVSVPVYDPTSDAARALADLEPLSRTARGAERQSATERVLATDRRARDSFFDARTGVSIPESGVEARIL